MRFSQKALTPENMNKNLKTGSVKSLDTFAYIFTYICSLYVF